MSEDKRRIQAEDLYRFELIRQLELSPDGKHVVFACQRIDAEREKTYCNLWLVPTEGGAARQFTVGNHKDLDPKWSPDGQTLAFLSNRDDEQQPQLYLIPVDGGEARCLTDLKGEIAAYQWSPDGTRLVFQFRQRDAEALAREEDEQRKKLGIVSRRITRLFYSLDGYGYFPEERWHLWVVEVASGAATQLTEGDVYDELSPQWSPDGGAIVFHSNRSADPDRDPDDVGLYVIPAAGGALRELSTPVGEKRHPVFSPDGAWVAYIGHAGRGDWWKNDGVWIVPADGTGEARNLLVAHDVTASSFTLNDLGGALAVPPVWSPDGAQLYVQVSRHGKTLVCAVAVADGALTPVIDVPGVVLDFSFNAAQTRLAYSLGTLYDPGQIRLRESADGATRALTHVNAALLAELDLGAVEEVWFQGADGNDLQGWILTPPDFDPEQRYPSILEIHGGPHAQYGYFFMHEFYYLAAQGYVVYFCNPRGGLGYGEEHARAIWGEWGAVDYADLMAWADYVQALPYIDAARMGVTGGSYGGYMTAWIIGHTARFEAAVAQRSVTNLISMWGSSDMNWSFQQTFGDQPPYVTLDLLWQCSPMKHIGSASTPTLVIHSERDLRCPLEQGQQLFVALKMLGVDTEMVLFPEEQHGLSRMGRTDRRIARLESIAGWFARYLAAEDAA